MGGDNIVSALWSIELSANNYYKLEAWIANSTRLRRVHFSITWYAFGFRFRKLAFPSAHHLAYAIIYKEPCRLIYCCPESIAAVHSLSILVLDGRRRADWVVYSPGSPGHAGLPGSGACRVGSGQRFETGVYPVHPIHPAVLLMCRPNIKSFGWVVVTAVSYYFGWSAMFKSRTDQKFRLMAEVMTHSDVQISFRGAQVHHKACASKIIQFRVLKI